MFLFPLELTSKGPQLFILSCWICLSLLPGNRKGDAGTLQFALEFHKNLRITPTLSILELLSDISDTFDCT